MRSDISLKFTKFFLTLVVLIDFMGLATVVVLFPHLFLGHGASLFSSSWSHGSRLIALGFCLAIYPLGQFFGSSIFGKLSDSYGRKSMLFWTIVGTLIGFVLSAISVYSGSFILLFISRAIAGFCAGNTAIAQASLVDISTEKTKAQNLSLAQMAMGSAYVVGPTLGAIFSNSKIISWFSPSIPFLFFIVILVLELLLLCFFYKDTLNEHSRIKINLFEGVKQIYNALTDRHLRFGFLVWLVFVAGWWLFESFMPAFLLQKFHFDTSHIGYLLSFNGALYAAFQYLVVQRISHKIKPVNMVIYSTVLSGLAIVAMAFVVTTFQLYLAMIVFVLAMGFCIPGLLTSISNMANENQQGQVMGMIGSVQALATVVVMLAGGYLQALNINITMIGGGALIVLSWVIFLFISSSFRSRLNKIVTKN